MSADANIAGDNVPQLTINHEAVVDLDSSSAFEGKQTPSLHTSIHTDNIQDRRSSSRFGLPPPQPPSQNPPAMPRLARLA